MNQRNYQTLAASVGGKFTLKHVCKNKYLNSLIVEEQGQEAMLSKEEIMENTIEVLDNQAVHEGDKENSINVVTGSVGRSPFGIIRSLKGKPINILEDNGSSYNFFHTKSGRRGNRTTT